MIDPEHVYKEWFEEVDAATFSSKEKNKHTEL